MAGIPPSSSTPNPAGRSPRDIIQYPAGNASFEEFQATTTTNILFLFGDKFGSNISARAQVLANLSLEHFTHNTDHGMEHAWCVYTKAMQIANTLESTPPLPEKPIDRQLIYLMALAHDSARTVIYEPEYNGMGIRTEKSASSKRREKRNDSHHEQFGWVIAKKRISYLRTWGYYIAPEEEYLLEDYLVNHDFLSQELNGERFKEPISLEGQIVRLADRTSVPIIEEINRYQATGKRLQTPFFFPTISMDIRMNFSFDKLVSGAYKSSGIEVDQIMFFISMLMIDGSDFSHPALAALYNEWALQKGSAAGHILHIADTEGITMDDQKTLRFLLEKLGEKHHFSLPPETSLEE